VIKRNIPLFNNSSIQSWSRRGASYGYAGWNTLFPADCSEHSASRKL